MSYDSCGEPQISIMVKEEDGWGQSSPMPDEEEEEIIQLPQDDDKNPDPCSTLCWAMALPVAILSIYYGMVWAL